MAPRTVANIKSFAIEKQADEQRQQRSGICFPLRKEVKGGKWHKRAREDLIVCMGRYFKDYLADPGAGAGRGKRSAEAWDEFLAGSPRVEVCQYIHGNRFLKDRLPLGAVGYSVILQQVF